MSETEKKLAELESKIKDEMNEWIHAEHQAEEQGRSTQRIYCRGKVDGLSRAAFVLFEARLDVQLEEGQIRDYFSAYNGTDACDLCSYGKYADSDHPCRACTHNQTNNP